MIEWKSTLHVRSVHAIPRFGTPLLIAHIHATKQPSENKSAKNSIHLNVIVLCLLNPRGWHTNGPNLLLPQI